MFKVGVATFPLDYGKCPFWLFERMKRLSRAITIAIIEEYGKEEFLKRLADPIWFQSFGCTIGFDYNSSGLTTITLGALKEALRGLESELEIFICGGKKNSRKTPDEIREWGSFLGWDEEKIEKMVYNSKISAKVDSALLQDGYQLYHHNFIFSKSGDWIVIQQGMQPENKTARRYHWLSFKIKSFTKEPHSGIISQFKVKRPLNLLAKESEKNKKICLELATKEPKTFLKDIKIISEKSSHLIKQKRFPFFVEMEMKDVEFYHHPVEKEKFDLKRLKRIIEKIHFFNPKNFEQLLMIEGVGPKTIRALTLVSELIYGAPPSYEDPARYSFCVGGKDKTPYPIDKKTYDEILEVMEKGIEKAKISNKEKEKAKRRLYGEIR